ncbi:MAG: hypothetical protein P1P64_04675 [Treponemataceae bacterium]
MVSKRTAIFLLISLGLIVYIALKLTTPLFFENKDISEEAVSNLIELQKSKELTPSACAEGYLYYKTDYQDVCPKNSEIKIIDQQENQAVVKIFEPNCDDDSIKSSVDIIYLVKDKNNLWIVVKHKHAHTGRGVFGWTTKPTH